MIKKSISAWIMIILATCISIAQDKMEVKDTDGNVLMRVNDEGTVGSITLPSGVTPTVTANKLYNVGGVLYWNGDKIPDGYSLDAADGSPADGVYVDNDGEVGIGTISPDYPLHVWGGAVTDVAHFRGTGNPVILQLNNDGTAANNVSVHRLDVTLDGTDTWNRGELVYRRTGTDEGRIEISTQGTSKAITILNNGDTGIGVEDPDAKLEVNGQVKITGGSPVDGNVLTSDDNGLASWQSSGFGVRVTKAFDTNYLADTDGLVVAYGREAVDPRSMTQLTGYADGSATPTTMRAYEHSASKDEAASACITMPVKKGEYWRVDLLGGSSGVYFNEIYWIPLGN